MGWWDDRKKLERSPHPLVFSFKSQNAVWEPFKQRRALMGWEPGGSEGSSHLQPWR